MKLEFIANASFVITLESGATILTDPWLSDGIYYGSWYNFPPIPDAMRARVLASRPSLVYVSHLHPDHLDAATLAQLPRSTPIAIGKLPHDHLRRQLAELGFTHLRELPLGELRPMSEGAQLAILAAFGSTGDGLVDEVGYAIDTSLVVRDRDGTQLLHGVDNPIRVGDATGLVARFGRPDIAILPYGGANFYPHAGRAFTDDQKAAAASAVGARRLGHFVQLAAALDATWTVPAAGSYVMGGRISSYSRYLHQATPGEIATAWAAAGRDPAALCVMMPGDTIDTTTRTVTRVPDAAFRDFTAAQRAEYAHTLAGRALPQDEIRIPRAFRVPWPRLLAKARRNLWQMQTRMKLTPAVDVELHVAAVSGLPSTQPLVFAFALDAEAPSGGARAPDRPVVAFHLDASLLLMVLVGAANWNNVEIAALVEFERTPERYEPTVHSLMSFFTL